jgi:hypothetical protein
LDSTDLCAFSTHVLVWVVETSGCVEMAEASSGEAGLHFRQLNDRVALLEVRSHRFIAQTTPNMVRCASSLYQHDADKNYLLIDANKLPHYHTRVPAKGDRQAPALLATDRQYGICPEATGGVRDSLPYPRGNSASAAQQPSGA